jgi:glycosyltransferase involved in cell wall biosynthesis
VTGPGPRPPSSVRVLFLAWGFSIHARRRIQLFERDPDFSVAVVSTHDYGFDRARNIPLWDARHPGRPVGRKTVTERVRRELARFLPVRILRELAKTAADAILLRKAVRECAPQVLFLQTLLYPCYLAFLMPKSIPIVITFWNGDVTWWERSTGLERLFKKELVRYGVRRAEAITVNSRAAMVACAGYGAAEGKISQIRYPGVDRGIFRPSPKPGARRALGIGAGKVVLCPRGLGGYLNSDVIVESAAGVVERYPDALFLFLSGVGAGKVLERHRDRVRQLGLERNFRWEGQVEWERMPVYYNAADAMVSISSNDSLPNCMMEALACEVPVIMGDIPQIREWIADGRNGFLVPPRDPERLSGKILEVLGRPPEGIRPLTDEGRDLVAREFDGAVQSVFVKDLVRAVARGDGATSGS